MNFIEDQSKLNKPFAVRIRTGMLLASFALAAGIVVSLSAEALPELTSTNISKAVLLEWPEPAESCIVVATDSLTDPVWAPCPEPIFMRAGRLCMAVPVATTRPEQYFKLVPGIQFIDDFNPPKLPCKTKAEWVQQFEHGDDIPRITITNTNGTLRLQKLGSLVDGRFSLIPPRPEVVVGDFWASLDILQWDPDGMNQAASIGARIQSYGHIGYWGVVNFNEWNLGQGRLHLLAVGKQPVIGSTITLTRGEKFRLCFSGVGNVLSLRLYNLDNLEEPVTEVQMTDTASSQGSMQLAFGFDKETPSSAFTLDNFFVTGTKP